MYIGSFGGVIFSVSSSQILTIKNFKRTTKAKFQTHDILGATSKLEFVGTEPISINFEIQISAMLGAPVKETLETLREVCANGLVDNLIVGGEVVGLFVLETLDESEIITDGRGKPISVTVQLNLRGYNPIGDF